MSRLIVEPTRVARAATVLIALLLSIAPSRAMAQAHFAAAANYPAPSPIRLATGDFNGDGIKDLVAVENTGISVAPKVSVLLGGGLLGVGDGTFGTAIESVAGFSFPYDLAVVDFNKDGFLDVALANILSSGAWVSIAFGDGTGALGLPQIIATVGSIGDYRQLTVGDFNGDTNPDIVVDNYNQNKIEVLLGNGTGGVLSTVTTSFTPLNTPTLGPAVDFDGDGKLDLVVLQGYYVQEAHIMKGDGAGGFTLFPGGPIGVGNKPFDSVIGDFNLDGKFDVAVVSEFSTSILLGNGSGGFSVGTVAFGGAYIRTGDFDGDLKPDLALVGLGGGIDILRGNGSGGFTYESTISAPSEKPVVADWNGDSKPDLAMASGQVSVFLNNTQNTTTSLTSSSNPSVVGASVTFTATVSGPFPSGTMTFKADGVNIPDCGVSGVVTFTGSTATCVTTSLSVGSYPITADFVGNAPYNDSSASLAGGQSVVALITPTTTVTSSSQPSILGASVTFTATVTGSSPTGTVDFIDSVSGVLCAGVPLSTGVATCSTSTLASGPHTIDVEYSGDPTHDVSTGTLPGGQTVVPGTTFGNAGTYSLMGAQTVVAGTFDTVSGNVGLAVTQPGSDQISLLHGNGNGTFNPIISAIPVSAGPTALAAANFDVDAGFSDDLAVGNFGTGDVYTFTSDGLGNLPTTTNGPYPAGIGPTAAVAAPFDGNGPGLAVVNRDDTTVSVFVNDGNNTGVLVLKNTLPVGPAPVAIATGNFNGDSFPDLVVANSGDDTVTVMLFASDANLLAPSVTYSVGSTPSSVAVADVDGDGDADIVVTNKGDSNVTILLGDGFGGFTSGGTFPVGDGPESVVVDDLDGDTFLDLAVANGLSDNVSILYGDGAGNFSTPVNIALAPGSHPISIVTADFNGTKSDLAVATSLGVTILLNSITPPSQIPTIVSPATPGDGEVKIGFTIPFVGGDGGTPILGYQATCDPGGITGTFTPPPSSILVTGLTNGTTYTCYIQAYNLVGLGPASTTVVVTPQFSSSVAVFSSSNPSTLGATVTLFALISGPGATGNVDFLQDGIPIPSCTDVAVSAGFAACSIDTLELGANVITAEYSGDAANTPAAGALSPDQMVLEAAPNFGGPAVFPLAGPYSVTVANLNGDAQPDLIVTRPGGNELSYFHGQSGLFKSPVLAAGTPSVGSHPVAVAVGDFDGDGLEDHAVVNRDDGTVSVILGSGTLVSPIGVGGHPSGIAIGDFDGDTRQDLAVTNSDDDNVSILLGDGTGGFFLSGSPLVGDEPSAVAVGDVNGGPLDLVITNKADGTVSVLFGVGDGTFGPATPFGVGSGPTSGPTALALADVDNDLDLDIVVTNGVDDTVSVLLNDGFGDFSAGATFQGGLTPNSLAIADFNLDGYPDIVIANIGCEDISLLFGDGLGNFSAPVNLDTGVGSNPSSVVVTDFNADGLPDIAVTASGTNELLIFLNSFPTVLSASVSNITDTTAELSAYVTADGGSAVSDRGFLLVETAFDSDPEIGDGYVVQLSDVAGGLGPISNSLSALVPATQYSYRAFATNAKGTIYSPVGTFTTSDVPTVTSLAVTSLTTTTADLSADVTADGGSPVTDRGFLLVETAIDSDPEVGEGTVTQLSVGGTVGPMSTNLSGLTPSTQYSFRGYAINAIGTGYTAVGTFTTNSLITTTSTSLSSSRNPSNVGDSVILTATVSGATPTGTVDFKDGASVICAAVPLVSGQATCTTSGLGSGTHVITVDYPGDGSNTAGTGTLGGGQTVIPATTVVAGDIRISQFRFRGDILAGRDGTQNEFIELYVNRPGDVTVGADGWAVSVFNPAGSTKMTIATVPPGTVLKAKSYYLIVNNTATYGFTAGALKDYPAFSTPSLTTVGSGDLQFTGDIPDGAGLAIFSSAVQLDTSTRLDSVGFAGTTDTLYKEGAGLTPGTGIDVDGEHVFVRRNAGGVPIDTGNNEADFAFVSVDARTYSGREPQLGAPGPRGQSSGHSMVLGFSVIEPAVATSLPPNRFIDLGISPNRVEFRFRVFNNSGQPITALRWRFVTLTNFNAPGYAVPTQADMRPVTSVSQVLPATSIGATGVEGLTLELNALQSMGGGLNSTLVYALPAPLAAGAWVDINIVFSKVRGGTYKFLTQVEAVP